MKLANDLFKLELHWEDLYYEEGSCFFKKAYFIGPVLSIAEKIQEFDSINIDFYMQYYVLVESIYIGKLSWQQVNYIEDKIYLDNCVLQHTTELNKVPKLNTTDYMVIDCSNHDRSVHAWNPNYRTYIVNIDTQVYSYE